jgi:ATP-dependent Clp protease ATP-binding subunit ClpC
VPSLIAGTKFRGEFEERILNVLREATADPGLILFFDEIHTLVGAGANPGEAMDAANIVKPALARGELCCIGATTTEEYRRHIEKDSALERRFEPIRVEEPTLSEAQHILQGLVPALEDHHQVLISKAAVEAALTLTVRYLPGRRLPDKAIDALDQSCARVRLKSFSVEAKASVPIPAGAATVDEDAVACTVSQWTGIPLERVSGEQAHELLRLEEELRSRVVGQNPAVTAVTRAILTAKAGLADPDRPTGVFLFLGPTGVGKTEMAKSLADLLFGSDKRLIRFDMSEFTEAHSVAKLIGAPPGYVGHEQEGQLISAVRSHPHCVLLFDELEKAHTQIFDLFLQIFDEGRLRGAHGEQADFTNAVVILTSNLDLGLERRAAVGFGEDGATRQASNDPRALLARVFRPELVNRIDEIVVFNRLGKPELQQIIDRFVRSIEQLAAARDLRLELDEEVYEWLIDLGVSEMFGARELRRAIDRHLRQPLAEELLRHGDGAATVRVRVEGGKLRLVSSQAERPVSKS